MFQGGWVNIVLSLYDMKYEQETLNIFIITLKSEESGTILFKSLN